MRDIEDHARGILRGAQRQAEQLLIEAQKEAEALRLQAHAEGLAAGKREGLTRGQEEGHKVGRETALSEQRTRLAEVIAALTTAAGEINEHRHELKSAATRDVIDLAVAIADRVTKRRGLIDPSVAANNVTEALKLVVHSSDVRIAVHPTQRATLADILPRLQMQWPAMEHVELVEDATLAPGGCRVITGQGQVDGDLDEQLRRVCADLVPPTDEEKGL